MYKIERFIYDDAIKPTYDIDFSTVMIVILGNFRTAVIMIQIHTNKKASF